MHLIDLIDARLLKAAAPETETALLAWWADPLKLACRRFNIDTVREVACFLAQGAHESRGFQDLEEGLSYSAARLVEVWPKRFPTLAVARQYERNPEKLANYVYANRMGNGPPESGDGYRFRGYGVFQLTGRDNHSRCAKALGVPLARFPDYLRSKEGAAMSAAWFFDDRGLDRLAATPGVEDETRAINGGLHGVADRRARFNRVVTELLRRGA